MSSSLVDDSESNDINDTLINEAARLENEYENQKVIDEAVKTLHDLESNREINDANGGASSNAVPSPTELDDPSRILQVCKDTNLSVTESVNIHSSIDSDVKHVSSKVSTPEKDRTRKEIDIMKNKSTSSNRKRQFDDTSLDIIRPVPPDPKRLKPGFKIPKKNSKASIPRASNALSDEQKKFLEELDAEFCHRYSDQDEEYKKVTEASFPPPLVENFHNPPRRQFSRPEGSFYFDRNNDRNDRNNRNSHNSSRYSQPKYPRDYSNDRYKHHRHRYQPY